MSSQVTPNSEPSPLVRRCLLVRTLRRKASKLTRNLPVDVSLFILAVLFELGIALDACRAKNIMTLGVLCVFQFLMLVYSSVLPGQLNRALKGTNADLPHVHKLTHAYAIVIVAVVALASVCMSAMLWPLSVNTHPWKAAGQSINVTVSRYREMGWSVFRKIGADLVLRRMYTRYQIFVCLLKFDAFFLVGFSIQFLILVSGTPTVEMGACRLQFRGLDSFASARSDVFPGHASPYHYRTARVTRRSRPLCGQSAPRHQSVLRPEPDPFPLLVPHRTAQVIVRIESRVGVYGSWFVQAAGIAYFIYKMSRIFSERSRYEAVHATLTIFA